MIFPGKPQHHHFCWRLHEAAALLHVLLILGGGGAMVRAEAIPTPCCSMFQGLDLVPCLQAAGAGGGGNISGACCSSLNQALDAGRQCLCSLLLSSGGGGVRWLAGLATALPAMPLALPLPGGCFLYAAPLASCQVPVQDQTDAAAAAEATTASATAADSPQPQAGVTPPSKRKRADAMNRSNGDGGAKEAVPASRSDACRCPKVSEGIRTYVLTFVVVMAVFWLNHMVSS